MNIQDINDQLTRVHIRLMNHPETRMYSSVILLGKNEVVDTPDCPTAYTDGINKKYGAEFCSKLSTAELGGLVLHENGHVLLKHLPRHRDLMKEDPQLANIAMDYVVNLLIDAIRDKSVAVLPKGALLDHEFKGHSVREVYEILRQREKSQPKPKPGEGQGQGQSGQGGGRPQPLDVHDFDKVQEATPEQLKEISDAVDKCLHQMGIHAGRMGDEVPREIKEIMAPEVDWVEATREFVSEHAWGRDDSTWRKFKRKHLPDEIYLPDVHSESIDELIVACDLSGSVTGDVEKKLLSEVAHVAQTCQPKRLRVLWWDTKVRSEQVFEDNFDQIVSLLRPMGGGGTTVSCVSQYMVQNGIDPDCLVVLTDGYVETDVKWEIANVPTLWLVTLNNDFVPPSGIKVRVNS